MEETKTENGVRFTCHGELLSVRPRLDAAALTLDCEISLCLCAFENRTVTFLAESTPTEESAPKANAGLFAVYPQEGDTLFSLCAKYKKKRAAVASLSGLGESALALSHTPASLDGVHHLLMEE